MKRMWQLESYPHLQMAGVTVPLNNTTYRCANACPAALMSIDFVIIRWRSIVTRPAFWGAIGGMVIQSKIQFAWYCSNWNKQESFCQLSRCSLYFVYIKTLIYYQRHFNLKHTDRLIVDKRIGSWSGHKWVILMSLDHRTWIFWAAILTFFDLSLFHYIETVNVYGIMRKI